MQYEDWKYHPSRLPANYTEERAEFFKQLEKDFLTELEQDPKVAEYMAPYGASCHAGFLKNYAAWKRIMVEGADYRMQEIEKGPELRYREETENVFDAILYKKLFNLEMQWRANQIDIPGINITWDFYCWGSDVRACPFIEPVSYEEMALMQRFLQTDDCDLTRYDGKIVSRYSFDEFMTRDENGHFHEMPDWFEYYDTYMGTGHLLLLPDVRGEREEYYRNLYFESQREKDRAEGKPEYVYTPSPPYLSGISREEFYHFSKAVDDDIFQQLFQHHFEEEAAKRKAEDAAGVFDIEDIFWNLNNIPNPPPVRGGVSWREAIYYCWQDYLKATIGDDLPLVWEEYKFLAETGLTGTSRRPTYAQYDEDTAKMVAEQILNGRELAGEPRDFNF